MDSILMSEQEYNRMKNREEFSQHVFTVEGCGMDEFNGKYFVDIAKNNGSINGRHCYRKDGVGNAGSECTIEYVSGIGEAGWFMRKNYSYAIYYFVLGDTEQPSTSGWEVSNGDGPPPQLVFEVTDLLNFDWGINFKNFFLMS